MDKTLLESASGRVFRFVLMCVLLISTGGGRIALAQERITVTGTVVDESNEPVIGAGVLVKNTVTGVLTDLDGHYSIRLDNANVVLVFSYLGYTTQEISVGGRTEINVQLQPDSDQLDEVVVVGYGVQKKESVVGAISTVDVTNLKVPGANLSTSLAGQLAGVVSMNRSGEPGKNSAAEFYIRGVSSFSGSSHPLVLVDGIERDLDLVDTDDIESFSILKDASASAVYGVRGANGVILITTKKGREGRPEIKVRSEAGMTQPTRLPRFANAWQTATMANEVAPNSYSEQALEAFLTHSDPYIYPDVDWMKELYRDMAFNERANLSITGGGDIARYYISGSFYNESSIFRNAGNIYDYDSSINYNKFNFRANVDMNLTPTTVLNLNLANIYEKRFAPGASTGDIWSWAFQSSPQSFPKEYEDRLSAPGGSGYNPWNFLAHSGYREQFWNSAQSLIGVTQRLDMLAEGLTANVKFSWDAWNTQEHIRSKTPQTYTANGRDENGDINYVLKDSGSSSLSFSSSASSSVTTYLEASLNYSRLLADKHRVGALFLYNHKILRYTAGVDGNGAIPYKNQGIAARATYAFRDKYMFEFNMGYNGSENFAPGHRFGFFPAVSAGWLISEEPFWQPIKPYVSTLKFRGSYGKVGNDDVGGVRWLYLPTIIGGNSFNMGESGNTGGGGTAVGRPVNELFSWEEELKLDLGVEMLLFNSLRLQVDYFHNQRTGILMNRTSLPGFAGLYDPSKQPWVSIGETDNKGIDMTLEWNQRFGEWFLTARGNFTYNRNKLVDIDQPDMEFKYRNRIGKSYGAGGMNDQPFGLLALGLFQSQEEIDNSPEQEFGPYRVGDIKYQDINGDGVINANDQIYLGYTTMPEITYGFGATASWKGIDMNVFFQGVDHVNFFLGGASLTQPFSSNEMSRNSIQLDVYNNRYVWNAGLTDAENAAANAGAVYPRMPGGIGPNGAGQVNNNQRSSWWMRNGAFLRLKNVEVGYTLPKSWMVKAGFIQSVRVYLSANNLCTFSAFKLWDPELGGGSGNVYPTNRIISAGLNANF